MAMFNKTHDDGKSYSEAQDTIIGESVKLEGDFVGEGNVIVHGAVHGSLTTKRNLEVGPTAMISANVHAENAVIAGDVDGNVTVSHTLELKKSAKITGDIQAQTITMEAGALLNGKCSMNGTTSSNTADTQEEKEETKSDE